MTSRRAVVTGGVAGIGEAIARKLAGDGLEVIAIDISDDKITAFRAETGLPAYRCDVSQPGDVQTVFAQIEASHGPVDVIVNNAGITRDAMLHKMSAVQWQQVVDVNLTSVFNTVRYLAPRMRERGFGRIVNISSMSGLRGNVGQANYVAAKAGMIGLTKTMALELASKGITANCITPGFILTDMTRAMPQEILQAEAQKIPVGRLGTPDDIAAAVSFLVGDSASFITGQVLSVNGGQYM
jgi:acetoacetyl-CoA reductase